MARNTPAKTAAEEELAQRDADSTDTLAEQAKEQKAQQKEQLAAGRKGGTADDLDANEAHSSLHADHMDRKAGIVPDQLSVNLSDEKTNVAYGHFCTGKDVQGNEVFGVFADIVEADKTTGLPTRVLVRRRDNHQLVEANYADLSPAVSRGAVPVV